MSEEIINNTIASQSGGGNETPVTVLSDNEYVFDGKYGPIPNADGTVDLSNYASKYIVNYSSITQLPAENKAYLDEVLTTGKYKVTNMSHMFDNCNDITSIDTSNWDTSNVTDMSYMFAVYDYKATGIKKLDLSSFDTSKVTDMSHMFDCCYALTSIDTSKWDTSNVTDMSYMFNFCQSLTSLDVSNFDTSNVTNMNSMFYSCKNLTSINITNCDTSNVTDMSYMFMSCDKLQTVIGILDLTKCNGFYKILYLNSQSLKSINILLPNSIDKEIFLNNVYPDSAKNAISFIDNKFKKEYNFDRKYIVSANNALYRNIFKYGPIPNENNEIEIKYYIQYMFNNSNIKEIPTENKAYLDEVLTTGKYKVTNMSRMFYYCTYLTSIDVSNWDTSNVTDMSEMFENCQYLTSLDVSKWNTSKVTNMNSMFFDCYDLTSLDVSKWNTSNVTDMDKMFYYCKSLTSLDVSNFDTSNVTDMNWMFWYCSSLTSLDVSNWDTSNVTDMNTMFYNCSSLTSLDVSNWDTSNVTSTNSMFINCNSLTSLDLTNWDTSNITNMGFMFSNCPNLKTITGTIDLTSCTVYYNMLKTTSALTSINIKLPSTITQSDFLTGSGVTNTSAVHFVS